MAFVKPTPEAMRAEFQRLVTKRDALAAEAAPAREAYDAKRNEIAAREAAELTPLAEAVKAAEADLFQVNQDIAELSRWLKGRTGAAA